MNSRYQNLCPNCFASGFDGKCISCGYSAILSGDNFMLLIPGFMLNNRYVVGRALGSGGFGITYLAFDTKTNERVAVKEYLPTGIAVRNTMTNSINPSNQDSRGVFEHGLKVFLNEASVLQHFAGQNAIVQVKDCFQENGTAYFSMEFLDGVNLKALARNSNNRLPYKLAYEVLVSVGVALDVVHSKGLLHRDVSPENIYITKTGEIKLIDFGATRYFVGEKSRSLSVILKPGFAPPEQYSTKGAQGPWTDVYALAATFYTVVSGVPMPDSLERLDGKDLPKLNEVVPEVTSAIASVIEKALELKYQQRFQSMRDFLAALHGASGQNGANAQTKQKTGRTPKMTIKNTPFVLFQSKDESNKWIMPKNMEMSIGRSPEHCNIVIGAASISRVHCTLIYDEKQQTFYIKDVSTNGTYLTNGNRLPKNELHALRSGESFCLLSSEYLLKVGLE